MKRPGEVHIGNSRGLVAIWCDEGECYDLAYLLHPSDKFRDELFKAAAEAYPPKEEDDNA